MLCKRGRFRSSKTKNSSSHKEHELSPGVYIMRLRFLMCIELRWDTRKLSVCDRSPQPHLPLRVAPTRIMNPLPRAWQVPDVLIPCPIVWIM